MTTRLAIDCDLIVPRSYPRCETASNRWSASWNKSARPTASTAGCWPRPWIPPQLEAPQEASEEAESVEEAPDRAEPRSSEGEVQEELDTARARCEMAETTMHKGMTEERRRREKAERERDQLRGE
jgi:hypothetical protein